MYRIAIVFVIAVLAAPLYAQMPVDYNDVGVIINQNDSGSVYIGQYFAQKRNVPQKNLIYVDAPAKEVITIEEFTAMRTQIESYLQTNNLTNQLNYLVTTKGVPLSINQNDVNDPELKTKSASVDAELMLILGPYTDHIGMGTLVNQQGQVQVHPYYNKNEKFSRSKFGMYLVTRLIALTKERVIEMIDRTGPFTYVNKDSAKFVLDYDPTRLSAGYKQYNDNMVAAAQILQNDGWNVLMNMDSVYVTDQRNVIGYVSWGSNDNHSGQFSVKARPRNHWLPGSIAETYVSTGARNFIPGQEGGQSRIADLFEEGCTAASGYVFEPYTVALAWVNILFPRYTSGHFLADSYYMSLPTMSWMAIVVGDPKAFIITSTPSAPAPIFPPTITVCKNENITLKPQNLKKGVILWFNADSNTVKAAGPVNSSHPNYISSDSTYVPLTSAEGTSTYCVYNENYLGKAFAQVQFIVAPELRAGFTVSSDSVYLDQSNTVQFTDTTSAAVAWLWDFGDGTPTSAERAPSHAYTAPGEYDVKLTVSSVSCSKMLTYTVYVFNTLPIVVVTPDTYDFGGVKQNSSKDVDVTIENRTPLAAFVQAAVFEGSDKNKFSIVGTNIPFSVPEGSSKTFTVRYTPTTLGPHGVTLRIAYALTGLPAELKFVTFTGEGTDPTSIGAIPSISEYTLEQNYPNPFNPGTTIRFSLPGSERIAMKVFNAAGKEVATLAEGLFSPGAHEIRWDASGVPSGMYTCKLYTRAGVLSRSMTLQK